MDNHARTHKEVVGNIRESGLEEYVESILGDAKEVIPSLSPGWDIIFQDGGKYLYPVLYETTVSLLKKGAACCG